MATSKTRPFLSSTTPKHTNKTASFNATPSPTLANAVNAAAAVGTKKSNTSSTNATASRLKSTSPNTSLSASSSSSSSTTLAAAGAGITKRVSKLKVNADLSSSTSPSTSPQPSPNNINTSKPTTPNALNLINGSTTLNTNSNTSTNNNDGTASFTNKSATRRRLSVMAGAAESHIDGVDNKSSGLTTTSPPSSTSAAAAAGAVSPSTSTSGTPGTSSVTRRRLSIMAGAADSHLDGAADAQVTAAAASIQPQHQRSASSSSSSSSSAVVSPSAVPVVASAAPKQKKPVIAHHVVSSKVGFVPFNPNKVNQDRFSDIATFAGHPDRAFFAVFDGHGAVGHEVSQFCCQEVPKSLRQQPAYLQGDIPTALERSFIETHERLASASSHVDCTFSGTTAIAVYIDNGRVFSANAGDSRAVLARHDPATGMLTAVPLSSDHKPDRADEKDRIIRSKGRVEPCKGADGEEIGPARVWLLRQDVPGLAMTRSIGDLVAQSVGVIPKPEIWERTLTGDDKFMVLASDGVWEFVSNQEAVDIIARAPSPQEAVKRIVDESVRRWHAEEEVVDDITAVIVYFQ